ALEGFSSYRNYFREALEKLSVKMHVFRAGDFKSAVEPYLRDDMSPQEKEVTLHWLQQIWAQFTSIVETQRDLEAGSVDRYINSLSETMIAEKGNVAEIALNAGLVDKLMSRDEGNKYLVEVVGASNDDGLYEAVEFERYIARKRPLALTKPEGSRVAVVTAYGNILPGDQPPGTIGGDSLARLIRSTADDDNVAAIVMRVTSGGGSMFASEVVRQQVLYAQSKGLPFVVSMGSVAASGGYYIAAPADQIWATPSTITGSIGVFAAFPTFEDLLQRVGIYTDGVGTTELAGSIRADRPLNPELVQTMNSAVGFAYDTFLEVVAEGRAMSVEDVDTIAQGRVWSASDALDIGLVDALGSLEQAVDAAAELAAVEDYKVDYVDYPLSPRDQFMKQLANRVGSVGVLRHSKLVTNVSALLAPLGEAAEEISLLQDPRHLYMRCVSCAGFK
ncbi:MAG: signal peptide peptidase SppA, partial [Pseudomonadota bacterium]